MLSPASRQALHSRWSAVPRCRCCVFPAVELPSSLKSIGRRTRRGVFLQCHIELNARDQELSLRRRLAHQTANHQSSALAILAMMLLLAVCGWIVGGTEGMQRALMGTAPRPDSTVISPASMYRWFGARLLSLAEAPELFAILAKVCSRAVLARLPDLYCLPAPGDMNAYALGGPEHSAIVLTEGLLRGM